MKFANRALVALKTSIVFTAMILSFSAFAEYGDKIESYLRAGNATLRLQVSDRGKWQYHNVSLANGATRFWKTVHYRPGAWPPGRPWGHPGYGEVERHQIIADYDDGKRMKLILALENNVNDIPPSHIETWGLPVAYLWMEYDGMTCKIFSPPISQRTLSNPPLARHEVKQIVKDVMNYFTGGGVKPSRCQQ